VFVIRAKEIWGSWDELAKEKRRRGIESQEYLDGNFYGKTICNCVIFSLRQLLATGVFYVFQL